MPPQTAPQVGEDVTHLMGGSAPAIGQDVSHLMAAEPDFKTTNATDANGKPLVDQAFDAAKNYLGEATQSINPVTLYHTVKSIVSDLPGVVQNIGKAQGALYTKAVDAAKDGDYASAARHMIDYAIPLFGPRLDQAGDYAQQGEWAKALGVVTDLGLQMAAPKVIDALPGRVSMTARLVKANPNPAEASAVGFGEARGIPIDAGTKTGSQFLKNVQKRVGGTWAGAPIVEAAQRAQDTNLARVGSDLAAQASNRPMSPVSAGESVVNALQKQIRDYHADATQAYDSLRQMEAQRAATIQQTGGVQAPPGAAQPFTTVPLAVDVRATKAALQPLYESLQREKDLVGTLQGGKARTLVALDTLMRGPDLAPLSDTDAALGNLKAMARTDGMPELRTQGQASAAEAVKALDAQVQAAAARGGPDVLKALRAGRAATVAKYDVGNALEQFGSNPDQIEPARVYATLTQTKDLALTKLQTLQRLAPDQVPNIARAYLEHAMDTATEAGGFAHADKLFADWQKLGPQTKQVLFPNPGQVQALNDFFLLAKKLKENPNPSGTANVLNATQILAGIPAWGLAKMLYAPRAVRALTSSLRMSVSTVPGVTRPAAQAAAVAQVVRAAQEAGVALPMAAQAQPATTPAGP